MDKLPDCREGEEWRAVLGYEEYLVSSLGRLWSCKSGREIAVRTNKLRYHACTLSTPTGSKRTNISRLVLSIFDRPPTNGEEAHHRDGNPSNNCISNLEWASNKLHHARLHGSKKRISGIGSPESRNAQIIRLGPKRRLEVWTGRGTADGKKIIHVRQFVISPRFSWYPVKVGLAMSHETAEQVREALSQELSGF